MYTQPEREFGPLAIDTIAREVRLDGVNVDVTGNEYLLLEILTAEPRRAFSSDDLMRRITGSDWAGDTHALQMCVSRLRTKLGESGTRPRQIVTVHGFGYRFEPIRSAPQLSQKGFSGLSGVDSDGNSAMYVIASLNRTILWVSDSTSHLIGWRPSDLEGTNLYDLLHPDEVEQDLNLAKELNEGQPASRIGRIKTVSGDFRLMEALVRPIIAQSGATEAFLGEWRAARHDQASPRVDLAPIHLRNTDMAQAPMSNRNAGLE